MAIYHDTLFICGGFWCFGITSNVFRQVIATDGTSWFNVGETHWPWTSAMIEYNGQLYIGGYYGVMEYQGGTNWELVSPGPIGRVNDMDVDTFNNFLYVGGSLQSIGNISYTSSWDFEPKIVSADAAYYDGFEWHSMGDILTCDVYQQGVKYYHGHVYMGGCFDTLETGVTVNHLARWDGTQWDSTSCNLNAEVAALEVFRDTLFIGGYFTAADGTPADGIVKYFAPDTGCTYLQPLVQTYTDTFYYNRVHHNFTVDFFNNNAYADTWLWDFDDGSTDVYTQNATHVFNAPGSYNVSVTVNHGGCSKTATRVITIIENPGEDELSREALGFRLFPNPTSGAVSVECTLPQDKTGELRTHLPNGGYKNSYQLQSGFNHVDIPASDINYGLSMLSLFVEGQYLFSEKVVRE